MSFSALIIGTTAFAMSAIAEVNGEVVITDCLLGLKPALESGDFSGSLDCSHDKLSVERVGQVRTFTVYSYRYKLAPPCPDCAIHGGHRIIFVENGRYVGQYRADGASAMIRDGNLFLKSSNGESVAVEFTAEGPQNKLLVDGELTSFFR